MKHISIFYVSGSIALFTSCLLKILPYSNLFSRVPVYIGPPVEPSILHIMQMWQFPYVLDTFSYISFIVGIGFIISGLVINIRERKLSSNYKERITK